MYTTLCLFKYQRPADHLTAIILFFPGIEDQPACSTCCCLKVQPSKPQSIAGRASLKPDSQESCVVTYRMENAPLCGDRSGVYMSNNTLYNSKMQKSDKRSVYAIIATDFSQTTMLYKMHLAFCLPELCEPACVELHVQWIRCGGDRQDPSKPIQ